MSRAAAAAGATAPALRAVLRWAVRLFRRDWRSQALVLVLLSLAVALAVAGATIAFNILEVSQRSGVGAANHVISVERPDPADIPLVIAAAEETLGEVEDVRVWDVDVPGLFESLEVRHQELNGRYSGPTLAVVEGRTPAADDEIAVTDRFAAALGVEPEVGATIDLADTTWTIVGVVENPTDLNDEFALAPPSYNAPPDRVMLLVDADPAAVDAFHTPSGSGVGISYIPADQGVWGAAGVLLLATVLLTFVALVAAAGFAVTAHRRLRQLGMLAAIGASERHLRLVMVANGALLGAVAAIVGVALGGVLWIAVGPLLETGLAARLDPLAIPWWAVGVAMALAVATATVAAWWPARAIASTPIVAALSGRPPEPRPIHRSTTLAILLLVAGIVGFWLTSPDLYGIVDVLLLVASVVALIAGALLVGPLAISSVSRLARWLPVAARLALRDLNRFRARSTAALAAIGLALGIATIVVLAAGSAVYGADEGNLPPNQVLVRVGAIPESGDDVLPIQALTPGDLRTLDATAEQIAAVLGDRTEVRSLDVVTAPDLEGKLAIEGVPTLVMTRRVGEGSFQVLGVLAVATPQLLDAYGLDLATLPAGVELMTIEDGDLWIQPEDDQPVVDPVQLEPSYTSLPGSFISTAGIARRGWAPARSAWWLVAPDAITAEQLSQAREIAAGAGLSVEARRGQGSLKALQAGATVVGLLAALAILAATVGLIRSEMSGDIRILTASGATSTIRRNLAASTAGGLAVLGVILGTTGAYLGFAAFHSGDLDVLLPIPVGHLVVLVVGVPSLAAAAGWLIGGKEPPAIARNPIA